MVSSIGEAKKHIADANVQAAEAQKAIDAASAAVEEAVDLLKKAAEDSGHEDIQAAFKAFGQAAEAFADARKQVDDAVTAANDYAETLG